MVDLPAPFWPISAWTSPAATSSVAALKAGMPPNALLIARIDRRGDAVDFRRCHLPLDPPRDGPVTRSGVTLY